MSGMGMYEYWQSPSLGKRARSPVDLRQDLQDLQSRDADAADDLDNLHVQKRYLSEVIACGLSKLNFNMPSDEQKYGDGSIIGHVEFGCGPAGPVPPRLATYAIHTPSAYARPKSPTSSFSALPGTETAHQAGEAHLHHQALLPRSFSQIEQQPMRDLGSHVRAPSGSSQQSQQQQLPQPHNVQQAVHRDLHQAGAAAGALASSSSVQQDRFASPTDTKAKLDLRKTALLRSLLIRTESNSKQLEATAEGGCMDEDDDDPMSLSPTPELPEASCEDDDLAAYGSGLDTMECSSNAYQHAQLYHQQLLQQQRHELQHQQHQHLCHLAQQQPGQLRDGSKPHALQLLQPNMTSSGRGSEMSAAGPSGIMGSFLWRQQLEPLEQQKQQQEPAAGGEPPSDLPADRLELVRAKALAGSRISASELEARPKQQFATLPHLRSKPGAGGIMRRTSSHI